MFMGSCVCVCLCVCVTWQHSAQQCFFKPFLINPYSTYMKRWDFLMIWLMVYTASVTPYYVAFLEIDMNGPVYWINKFVDICFAKDLVMNFMLAYQNESYVLIKDQEMIIRNYLTGWFAVDLLSIIPYDLLAQTDSVFTSLDSLRLVRLVRLLKLARVLRSGRLMKRWETSVSMKFSHLSIIWFVGLLTVTAHWLACLWFLVVDIENSQQNWLYCYDHVEKRASCEVPSGILNGTIVNGTVQTVTTPPPTPSVYENGVPIKRYIASLYWATMTLLTIGYGDIKPRTDAERSVALIAMLTGASIYAYVVGAACQVISKMDWHSNLFYARLDDVNEYMQDNKVPSHPVSDTPQRLLRSTNPNRCRRCRKIFSSKYGSTSILRGRQTRTRRCGPVCTS